MYRYVLFDLDGTLTDPREGICKSVQYALQAQGIEEPDLDKLEPFIGPPLAMGFTEFYGMDEMKADEAVKKYRERYYTIGVYENEMYPGMKDFLADLEKKGIQLAVASGKPQELVEKVLGHFGIRSYFRVVAGSDLDGKRVDKAQVIQEVFRQLFDGKHIPQKDILMVGDRKYDVHGAEVFGLKCAAVSYGYGEEEELRQAGAAYITDNLDDLFAIITGEEREKGGQTAPFRKSLRILSPMVYEFLLSFLVIGILQFILGILLKNPLKAYTSRIGANAGQITVYMDTVSAVVCIFLFAKMYNREKKQPISHVVKRRERKKLLRDAVPLAGLSAGLALFLNGMFVIFESFMASEAYERVAGVQYSVPLLFGIVNYGLIKPLEEELVFRGLVYGRMRQYFSKRISILVSAFLFGAYHRNVVQAAYGFLMGCFLAWAFERYKSLKAPLIVHGTANVAVYLVSSITAVRGLDVDIRIMVIAGVFCIGCGGLLLGAQNVQKIRKIKDSKQKRLKI